MAARSQVVTLFPPVAEMLAMLRNPLVLTVVALGIGATAWGQEAKPSLHTVAPGPLKVEVTLPGVFEAESMSEVVVKPRVWSTLVIDKIAPQGTKVEKGAAILWLETEQLDDELAATQLALDLGRLGIEMARSELEALQASVPLDLKDAERTKQVADKTLEHFLKTDEQFRRRDIEEQLKNAENMLEGSQEELKQLERMYKADELTEETEEIILKRQRREVERAQYFVDKQRVQRERQLNESLPREKEQVHEAAGRAALALAKALATLPRSLDQKRIELQKLEYAQKKLQQKYERLQADRQEMIVQAPISGYVYYGASERGRWGGGAAGAKPLRKGTAVAQGQTVMTVVSPSPMFVRVDAPEKDLHHLNPGIAGSVVPVAFAQESLPARLAAIEPVAVREGVYDGRVSFEGGARLMPGMTCTVRLVVYAKADVLTVPAAAVQSDELDQGKKFVLVESEGKPQRRDVTVGQSSGEKTEIVAGLKPGDKVFTKKPE